MYFYLNSFSSVEINNVMFIMLVGEVDDGVYPPRDNFQLFPLRYRSCQNVDNNIYYNDG